MIRNFQGLVAKVKNLVAVAPVLGAIMPCEVTEAWYLPPVLLFI